MTTVRQLLVFLIVVLAIALSTASSSSKGSSNRSLFGGETDRRLLPLPSREAYDTLPLLASAAQELGYKAYSHDASVHVELGDGVWIYYQYWGNTRKRFDQVINIKRGRSMTMQEAKSRAKKIWALAMQYRRDANL